MPHKGQLSSTIKHDVCRILPWPVGRREDMITKTKKTAVWYICM
jgi:hypothetical protein